MGVQVRAAPAPGESFPESKKHKFPVPSAGGSTAFFPQILGPSRRTVSNGMDVTHGLLCPLWGQGNGGPFAHLQGLTGKKPFCTLT